MAYPVVVKASAIILQRLGSSSKACPRPPLTCSPSGAWSRPACQGCPAVQGSSEGSNCMAPSARTPSETAEVNGGLSGDQTTALQAWCLRMTCMPCCWCSHDSARLEGCCCATGKRATLPSHATGHTSVTFLLWRHPSAQPWPHAAPDRARWLCKLQQAPQSHCAQINHASAHTSQRMAASSGTACLCKQ